MNAMIPYDTIVNIVITGGYEVTFASSLIEILIEEFKEFYKINFIISEAANLTSSWHEAALCTDQTTGTPAPAHKCIHTKKYEKTSEQNAFLIIVERAGWVSLHKRMPNQHMLLNSFMELRL